jgi:hypothetical protein
MSVTTRKRDKTLYLMREVILHRAGARYFSSKLPFILEITLKRHAMCGESNYCEEVGTDLHGCKVVWTCWQISAFRINVLS